MHRQHGLFFVDKGQVSDLAAGQMDGFLKGVIGDILEAGVNHLVEPQERLNAFGIGPEGFFVELFLGDIIVQGHDFAGGEFIDIIFAPA